LLVHDGGLVKTANFGNPKYVGDPINAVRIFNEKEVDELIVLDIDASVRGEPPNLRLIEDLAAECRMPLCYGGGVSTAAQAERIVRLGVEKVAFSSAVLADPELVARVSQAVGRQSVVVVLDVKKNVRGEYSIYVGNGKTNTRMDPFGFARVVESHGVGEIVINSIDNDGAMTGYDFELAKRMREIIDVPMTVLGGAGSHDDIGELVRTFKIVGAAAGSLFVFKGKYRAVLINYPTQQEKMTMLGLEHVAGGDSCGIGGHRA
jgi:cyclase